MTNTQKSNRLAYAQKVIQKWREGVIPRDEAFDTMIALFSIPKETTEQIDIDKQRDREIL